SAGSYLASAGPYLASFGKLALVGLLSPLCRWVGIPARSAAFGLLAGGPWSSVALTWSTCSASCGGSEGSWSRPTPHVSIIINKFNYARYVPQSIESALSQTYPHVEVLVVDDVSTDDSRSVIARYAGRVAPVLRDKNGGQGAAVNAGFHASRGDIVFFLDA